MRRIFLTIYIVILCMTSYGWGQTGHRVVGLIAERHLTKKARKNVEIILGNESLAEVSNYMDFIKSDRSYDHMSPWHYCTIPDDMIYQEAGTPEEGDVISSIERLIVELETKQFSDEDEIFALKCLIHLVGDIHQPLHVGNGIDKGGNDVKVEYFWSSSNLHRVWDSGIIDGQMYSYTEYANWIDNPAIKQVKDWQDEGVSVWAYESMSYRSQIYNLPENMKINYRYDFDNIKIINLRLLQAGVRLAGILNKIYG